jgi:hypothetical protein
MALHRGFDGSESLRPDPVGRLGGAHEERRAARTSVFATGTLACPGCDAPVVPDGAVAPAAPLACPYCGRAGLVRDFLSLGQPTRPTRVEVRIVHRRDPAAPGRPRRSVTLVSRRLPPPA